MSQLFQAQRRAIKLLFERAERSRTGAKSIKRGTEIPIAVLVPAVSMKRRFDLEGTVRGQMPVLARAIEKQLTKI